MTASFIDGLLRDRATPTSSARGTALLVPGFTGSKEDFRLLLPLLSERGWITVAYSQRGQNGSAAPHGIQNYRLDAFAADCVAVAEELGPVHLVGHSLGGLVARAAVIASPASFLSVTMLCSGPGGQDGRGDDQDEIVRDRGTLGLWESLNPDGVRTEEDRFFRDRAAASSDDNFLGGALILRTARDTTDELRATDVPVLVAHGDADEAWPQASQRDMAHRLGAEYAVIANAGHSPNLDNPNDTADLLSDFWARRTDA